MEEIRLTSWYVVNPITYKVLSPSQGGYLGFLPFLQYGAFGNGKILSLFVKLESTTSLHRLLCKGVLQNLPSRELTYPPTMAYLKMIFLFPRWDMLVPGRVFYGGVSNDHPCGSFKASKMMLLKQRFFGCCFLRRIRIANPVKGIVSVFKLAGKLVLWGVNFYSKCRHIYIYIYISYTWILWVLNCGGVYNSETLSCFYCLLGRSPTTCVSFLLFPSRRCTCQELMEFLIPCSTAICIVVSKWLL